MNQRVILCDVNRALAEAKEIRALAHNPNLTFIGRNTVWLRLHRQRWEWSSHDQRSALPTAAGSN
ncbi:hypothetical protein JKG47_09190 [Acidithiobacillus sp. MC6.1]|nr:hypothetical protein [Acidithiobacillus sp. MC6.1]